MGWRLLDEQDARLICDECGPAMRRGRVSGVRMKMRIADGEDAGESVFFFYAPGVPFHDQLIERHSLPTKLEDLPRAVGREFNARILVLTSDDRACNSVLLTH